MMQLLILLIVCFMLASAVLALLVRNMIAAVAAASVVSLALSVIFVLLRAPDVAMTEVAVGSGLSSLILALGLRRLGLWKLENRGKNLLKKQRKSREAKHETA
jgi:energy-converting hydrogenase B subunit D